jgi:hypothetical protein
MKTSSVSCTPETIASCGLRRLSRREGTPHALTTVLSACPPSVASRAAVYILDKSGYVKTRDSQNGFTAIIQHALPTTREPQCMDAEGTRTFGMVSASNCRGDINAVIVISPSVSYFHSQDV